MSHENVELVRRVSEALNQAIANGDPTPVLRDFLDPDIYWRAAEGAIDDVGGMRGHDDFFDRAAALEAVGLSE
jgi:hypothetical protein